MATDLAQMEQIAGQVQAALQAADLTGYRELLDPNVTWGAPDDMTSGCRNRDQVLTWYRRGRAKGVRADVFETVVLTDKILVGLGILDGQSTSGSGGRTDRWQILTVKDGRRYPWFRRTGRRHFSHGMSPLPAVWGQSGRGGGELEHRMAGCLLDEPLHRIVALRIEVWGGYRHVANVTLEDGTGRNWVDLLGVKRLRSPTMAKSDLWLDTHVVNPGHHSVGRHKPSVSIVLDRDHWCSPLLPSPTSSGGEEIRRLTADTKPNQRLHEGIVRSKARPELVGLCHRHNLRWRRRSCTY